MTLCRCRGAVTRCIKSSLGCSFQGPRSALQSHLWECPYRDQNAGIFSICLISCLFYYILNIVMEAKTSVVKGQFSQLNVQDPVLSLSSAPGNRLLLHLTLISEAGIIMFPKLIEAVRFVVWSASGIRDTVTHNLTWMQIFQDFYYYDFVVKKTRRFTVVEGEGQHPLKQLKGSCVSAFFFLLIVNVILFAIYKCIQYLSLMNRLQLV